MTSLPAQSRYPILSALQRAVQREVHILAERPDLLWQQLSNRLRWDTNLDDNLLEQVLQRPSATRTRPWVRLKTPFYESSTLIRTLRGHTRDVTACAISPVDSRIISRSNDDTLKAWDSATGRLLWTALGVPTYGHICQISADGAFIVTGGGYGDTPLMIWDLATGHLRQVLDSDPSSKSAMACAIDPSCRTIYSTGRDGWDDIFVEWDLATGQMVRRVALDGSGLAISPDGSYVVAKQVRRISVIDTRTKRTRCTWEVSAEGSTPCAISADGAWIVAPNNLHEHTLTIRDAQTGRERVTLTGQGSPIHGCVFSTDSSLVVSYSGPAVEVWDTTSSQQKAILLGHTGEVNACAISPDNSFVVSAGGFGDNDLKVWNLHEATSDDRGSPRPPTGAVGQSAYAHDGTFFITSGGGRLWLWDTKTAQVRDSWPGRAPFTISPDGALLLTPHGEHYQLTAVESTVMSDGSTPRQEVAVLYVPEDVCRDTMQLSPDGSFLLTARSVNVRNRTQTGILIWDMATRARRGELLGDYPLIGPGHIIIVADVKPITNEQVIKFWSADTLELLAESYPFPRGTRQVRPGIVSPDGSYVVILSTSSVPVDPANPYLVHDQVRLEIWDLPSGRFRGVLAGPSHTGVTNITDIVVSRDGTFLVTAGGQDRTLKIWDVPALQLRATLVGHQKYVRSCAISADGAYVLSGGDDKMLRVWDTRSGREIASLPVPGGIEGLAAHPDEHQAVAGVHGGNVYVVEVLGV